MNGKPTYEELEQRVQELERIHASAMNEEKYRLLFNSTNDAIFVHQPAIDGEPQAFIEVNDTACRLYGYNRPELLKLTPVDLMLGGHKEKVKNHISKTLSGGTNIFNVIHRTSSGKKLSVEISSFKFMLDGKPTIMSIVRNISERKQLESVLRESEEKYRVLFDQSLMGIYLHDLEGRILDANHIACTQSGYTKEELLSLSVFDFHPDVVGTANLAKNDILNLWEKWEPGERHTYEGEHQRKDGIIFPIEVSTGRINYKGEQYIIAIIQDITERKQAEEKLKESKKFLEKLTDVAYMADDQGNILWVNSAAERVTGLPLKDIIGKSFLPLFIEADHASLIDVYQRTLAGEALDNTLTFKSGVTCHFTSLPKYNSHGEIVGTFGVARDISDRLAAESALQISEARLLKAQEMAKVGNWEYDIATGKVWGSEEAFRIYGIERTSEFLPLDDVEDRIIDAHRVNQALVNLIAENREYDIEFQIQPKNKQELAYVHSIADLVFDSNGKPLKVVGVIQDITDRKHAELALKESENRYRHHFSQFPIPAFVWKFDGHGFVLSDYNLAAEDITEGRMEEIKGIYADKLYADTHSRHILESLEKCYEEHKSIQREFEYKLFTTGKRLWIKGTWIYIEPDTVVLHSEDITERRQALLSLKESKRFYQSIYHNAQVGLSRTRVSDGKVLECNQKMAHIFGYENTDEFIAEGILSERYVDKGLRNKALAEINKIGFIEDKEAKFYRRDGQVIWVRFDSRIFPEYGYMEDVVIDITDKKQAEEKLLHQQKAISLNNKIANVFLTSAGNSIFANTLDVILETLESPFGYFGYIDDKGNLNCPSMTRNIWDKCEVPDKSIVFPKEIWGDVWGESLKNAITVISNNGLKLPEGHIQLECAMAVPIIHHDEVIGQFVIGDKKSGYGQYEKFLLESAASQTAPILNNLLEKETQEKEYKKMQARIEQAQKMEAVGNLAGGIAHDFNNILFPIIGMSELMLEDLEPDTLVYENAQEIYKAGNRAKDLVSQILSFSRQTELEMMPVKLQKILKEVLKLCRSSIPTNIEIEQDIQQDCGSIWANAIQLHQIGMNLITNAYHAVQSKNGKITVQLKEFIITEDEATPFAGEPGKYALLSVSDNGTGIPEEIKSKIFEPYFTTKEKGKGTGLGLAVVYGIVKEFGGDVQVLSTIGTGTTFNIYLPLMKKTGQIEFDKTGIDIKTGHEQILLVDDELPITRLVQLMLERLGYRVTARTSSIEALETFKENPDKFDMVVSDMSMPNMTGDQLAFEIKKIRQKVPIVICTGFSERINKEKAEEIGINGFLMKPVIKSKMAQMIRKVLDEV